VCVCAADHSHTASALVNHHVAFGVHMWCLLSVRRAQPLKESPSRWLAQQTNDTHPVRLCSDKTWQFMEGNAGLLLSARKGVERRQFDKAERACRTLLLSQHPACRTEALLLLSDVSFQKRAFAHAEECANAALETDPRSAEACVRAARALHAQAKTSDAEVLLARAVLLNPHHAAAWGAWGALCLALGRHEEALGHFQTALAHQEDAGWHVRVCKVPALAADGGGDSPRFVRGAMWDSDQRWSCTPFARRRVGRVSSLCVCPAASPPSRRRVQQPRVCVHALSPAEGSHQPLFIRHRPGPGTCQCTLQFRSGVSQVWGLEFVQ